MLMAMGRTFHAYAYSDLGPLDESAGEQFLRALIASPRGVVLTNGTGAVGGLLIPVWFQPKTRVLEECFWWSSATGGRELLSELIEFGRKNGAAGVVLSTIENGRQVAVDRAVRRMGFTPHERKYLLKLV